MRYYALYDENNALVSIGIGNSGTEITKADYYRLLTEIREKAIYVESLYNGEITIDAIPTEWQEEIQRRVDERKSQEDVIEDPDITDSEALAIIMGGNV